MKNSHSGTEAGLYRTASSQLLARSTAAAAATLPCRSDSRSNFRYAYENIVLLNYSKRHTCQPQRRRDAVGLEAARSQTDSFTSK